MSEHFPAFSQDIFVTIVEIAIHLSKEKIGENKLEKKIMTFSSFSDNELKEVGPSSNNLSKDRQNSNLPVQGEGFSR